MVYAFQVYTGFQWTGYFAGEIRNARRTATTSIIGGLAASAVIYIVGVALIYHYYGFNFFGALVYNAFGGGTGGLSFAPYLPALVKFTVLPGVLRDLVVLAFVLAIFWWTPTGFMLGTRNLFAWSFDRLMPTGITRVSEKNHTPGGRDRVDRRLRGAAELPERLPEPRRLPAEPDRGARVGVRDRLDRGDRHAVPQAAISPQRGRAGATPASPGSPRSR